MFTALFTQLTQRVVIPFGHIWQMDSQPISLWIYSRPFSILLVFYCLRPCTLIQISHFLILYSGWRLDYFIVSPELMPQICALEHLRDADACGNKRASDHCPIALYMKLWYNTIVDNDSFFPCLINTYQCHYTEAAKFCIICAIIR